MVLFSEVEIKYEMVIRLETCEGIVVLKELRSCETAVNRVLKKEDIMVLEIIFL